MNRHVCAALMGLFLALGCKKEEAPPVKGGPTPVGVKLQPAQKIRSTPVSLQLPKGWTSEYLDGADAPEKDGPPPGLVDLSETQEVWKATRTSPSGRVDPWVTISVDRRLPKGTTPLKYMEALRNDQQKTGLRVRHLDTERIDRDGRGGYSIRDALDIPTGVGGGTPVIQVARLFVNGTLGITVTAMMMQDDRIEVDPEIRTIMDSIKFTAPLPKETQENFVP